MNIAYCLLIGLMLLFLLLKIIHLKSLICIFGGLSEDFSLEFYKNFMKLPVNKVFGLKNLTNQHFLTVLLYKSRFLRPQGPFSFRCRYRRISTTMLEINKTTTTNISKYIWNCINFKLTSIGYGMLKEQPCRLRGPFPCDPLLPFRQAFRKGASHIFILESI